MKFQKGHKDLVPLEARKRQAEKMRGRKASKETRLRMSLAQSNRKSTKGIPHFGHRGLMTGDKNPSKRDDVRLKISLAKRGKKRWWKSSGDFKKGNEHVFWQGGISRYPYPFEFDSQLKERIRSRDNYTCQLCKITEEEHLRLFKKKLSVNHIDYDKNNCREDNLNTLCNTCNARVNFNREKWTRMFLSS